MARKKVARKMVDRGGLAAMGAMARKVNKLCGRGAALIKPPSARGTWHTLWVKRSCLRRMR